MKWGKLASYIPITLIILTAACFRFIYLDTIPNAVSGDELVYPLTAKAITITGHDITGTWNPLSVFIFRYPPGEQQAELPYFLHLPASPFPFSLFLVKFPFALLSVGIVLVLYLIADSLFGNPAAIATGLIASVNPWLIVMGRTGYESTPATFFYLLGLYMLIRHRSRILLWSIPAFLLAFYSYIATKLIFIPFILLSVLLALLIHKGQYKKQYVLLVGFSVLIVTIFVLLLKTNPDSFRMTDLLTPDSRTITEQVNEMRKLSLQSVITPLLVNRYIVYTQVLFSKFFRIFSPEYLFVNGDQFFLPLKQGFFYYLDALFMFIGAFVLFSRIRIIAVLLFLFIITGTIPHIFHKTMSDFSIHLTMMFPFLILLAGVGISHALSSLPKRYFVAGILIIFLLYLGNIGGFVNAYFYRYPFLGSQDFPMRELSRYIALARSPGISVTVYSGRKGDLLKKYLFYTNSITAQSTALIAAIDTRVPFTFGGIRFTDCDTAVHSVDPMRVTIVDTTCAMTIQGTTLRIARLTDGGSVYNILNDRICGNVNLDAYPAGITLSQMNVEALSAPQFCKTYISL